MVGLRSVFTIVGHLSLNQSSGKDPIRLDANDVEQSTSAPGCLPIREESNQLEYEEGENEGLDGNEQQVVSLLNLFDLNVCTKVTSHRQRHSRREN